MKPEILERSTGNKNVEAWTFLPKDWNYHFEKYKCTWFARLPNFVMLKFYTPFDTHDLLLLNLITRKLFWMGSKNIETKIRDKLPGRLPNFLANKVVMNRPHAVLVEDKRFVIKYILHWSQFYVYLQFGRLG